MKNIFSVVPVKPVLCAAIVMTTICFSPGCSTISTHQWVDGNTFRIRSTGSPDPALAGKAERRKSAFNAAVKKARNDTIDHFLDIVIKNSGGVMDIQSTRTAIEKELSGAFARAEIIDEKYDDGDNCTIVYQIHAPGLKRLLESK